MKLFPTRASLVLIGILVNASTALGAGNPEASQSVFAAHCAVCQPGQIMQAAALLKQTPKPTDQQIVDAMAGNICRCGTYQRIRQAIKSAAEGV